MVHLDSFHGAALAVAVFIENGPGSATYALDYSFESPNDLVSPVPLASMDWDNSMIPASAQAGDTSLTFYIPTAPIWARVQLLSGTSVRVVFTMYEAHRTYQVGPMPPSQILTLP
jgi:hypothetical protein